MFDQKSAPKEEAIIDAARKRFAYYGYSKTTMDEIAADVGMGKASLYYYFPTKESLFSAVILREQNEFIARAEALIVGPGTAREKMQTYVGKRLDYFRQAMNLSKLGLQSFSELKPAFGTLFKDFAQKELGFLQQILEAGNRSAEFAVDQPEKIALVLLHILHGLRLRTLNLAHGGQLAEDHFALLRSETRIATEIVLDGIMARSEACPPNTTH